jgi:MFS family permease
MTGLHYGWVVVATGFTVMFLTYGAQYSFGLFFAALTAEFGWSRAALAGVFSLYAGTYSFTGLIAGRLTDRWGPQRVVALGALLLGLGLGASGSVRSLAPLYATYFVAGLGMSTAYVPCSSTAVRWFVARRGFAVGLVMAGAGVGVLVCPRLVAWLIARVGWRAAYLTLGTTLALALAALSRLLVRDPAARGLRPYSGAPGDWAPEPGGQSWPVRRALRHPSFLALAGVYTATWIPVFLTPVHLVPLAQDLGLSAAAGATALSILGAGSLAGRLTMGAVSDRIGRRAALAASLGLQALAFVGLVLASGAAGLFLTSGVYGFAYGAVTALMPAIIGDFFGPAHSGSLVGLIFGIAGPTSSLGPVLGGLVFDVTRSYAWAFGGAALLNLVALGLLALARPPGNALPGTAREL